MAAVHPIHPEPDDVPTLAVDLDALTIGDLEDFEDIVGVPFDEAEAASFRSVKAIKALVFLTMRKTNPGFTLDDARNVKVSALQLGTEEDPTAAGG